MDIQCTVRISYRLSKSLNSEAGEGTWEEYKYLDHSDLEAIASLGKG